MLKERAKGFLMGVIALILILSTGTAIASSMDKNVGISYRNIKLYIDGAEYVTKDANGVVVEPFIYDGTTYLPVRGVAAAFGKDVVWDGATSSIYIGKTDQNQPDNWLDRIQYSYFEKGNVNSNLWKINGKITDHVKNDYSNGMLFYAFLSWSNDYIQDDIDEANTLIAYPLNSGYQKLSGKIVLPKNIDIASLNRTNVNGNNRTADVFFYADGRCIYKATSVTTTLPFSFDLDVKGVNQLTIKVKAEDTYVALTDLALYK